MSKTVQGRLKSPVVWTSMAGLLLFILKTYGLLTPLGLSEDSYNELITLLFAVLTSFGIFNDPTNKNGF
jgi:phi LC3 family holin